MSLVSLQNLCRPGHQRLPNANKDDACLLAYHDGRSLDKPSSCRLVAGSRLGPQSDIPAPWTTSPFPLTNGTDPAGEVRRELPSLATTTCRGLETGSLDYRLRKLHCSRPDHKTLFSFDHGSCPVCRLRLHSLLPSCLQRGKPAWRRSRDDGSPGACVWRSPSSSLTPYLET
jgi:hypothetical protein